MPTIDDVHAYLLDAYEGLDVQPSWGERAYFYNPGQRFARGAYFLTLKEKDGENDRASALDRPNVWRMNFGLPRKEFIRLFGHVPARPGKGQVIDGPWDFKDIDRLMPHPVYGWASWVAVLNPTKPTFEMLKPLIAQAFAKASATFNKRSASR